MTYATYTEAADAYSGQYVRESTRHLEARENSLLTIIGASAPWKGSTEEVELAHVQAELRLREQEAA